MVDGLSSSDPETVMLALQATVRKFSNHNTQRSQSCAVQSAEHHVALHVVNCALRLPFSVCNFCAEPLMVMNTRYDLLFFVAVRRLRENNLM